MVASEMRNPCGPNMTRRDSLGATYKRALFVTLQTIIMSADDFHGERTIYFIVTLTPYGISENFSNRYLISFKTL